MKTTKAFEQSKVQNQQLKPEVNLLGPDVFGPGYGEGSEKEEQNLGVNEKIA